MNTGIFLSENRAGFFIGQLKQMAGQASRQAIYFHYKTSFAICELAVEKLINNS
jgi:hypothetical protein